MQSSPRIEELRHKFHENPRRYFAPLANEYRKAGDPEQAIAICRAHLAQQPGHMSGHVVYGQALYDAGRMDEAGVVFQQALALDPENIIVLRHLGDIARQRGEVVEARSWYSRALDGDPHDAEVAAYLAELTEPPTAAREGQSESQPEAASHETEPAELALQHETGAQAFAQTHPERADAEAEALTVAESEGLAAESAEAQAVIQPQPQPEPAPLPEQEPKPQPEPEPEPEPQAESGTQGARGPQAEPEPVAASEPQSDFGEWPELDAEREPALGFTDTSESEVSDDSLVSPYAREMDFVAPSEMKWDLNESPYLDLVESSASDDAWDSVRSETPEAPKTGVPGLVGEADGAPISAEAHAGEGSASTPAGEAETSGTPPEAPAQPPSPRTPSRAATPVTESAPIVTRTLAELYLQQGYIEPALEIYRQLADQAPGDAGLHARIEELSSEGASAPPTGEEVGASAPGAPLEAAEDPGTPEIVSAATPGVNAETTEEGDFSVEAEPSDEPWDSADSWGDWPFTDEKDREDISGLSEDIAESEPETAQSFSPAPEDEPVESEPPPQAILRPEPEREPESKAEPQSEPKGDWKREPESAPEPRWAQEAQEAEEVPQAAGREAPSEAAQSYAKPPVTVRDFFATLGAARPPSDGETDIPEATEPVARGSEPERSEEARTQEEYPAADDAFASLFAGVPVDSEDSRAAAVLSGAVAHRAPLSTPRTTPVAPPVRDVPANLESGDPAKESEEDIRRFREWLDGLAES